LAKKSKSVLNKTNKKNPKLVFFLITGVFILAMVLLFMLEKAPTEKQVVDFDLTGQPSIGKSDAPVKIVEFGDYKCIYCKNFDESIYPQIAKDYIDSGKVEFYFINKAFIAKDSQYAAVVGEGIYKQDPDAFWKYHHLVYANQGPETEVWASMEYLLTLVKENLPSIDLKELAEYASSDSFDNLLETDNKLSQQGNVTSTPTIFIDGVEVENSFDYETIQSMIDEALADTNE
jgi:protein-disulfide isomerase